VAYFLQGLLDSDVIVIIIITQQILRPRNAARVRLHGGLMPFKPALAFDVIIDIGNSRSSADSLM